MKKAGEKNPVFVLDEVDKLTASFNGDPASALLEVLDPEQNHTFSDHYLEVPYDLSDVFFVATANSMNTIPPPLLDRMEMIPISSYTNKEKFHIGKDHLLPAVLDDHGLTSEQLTLTDDGLVKIIDEYTREAGVRGLKKQLSTLARAASEKIVTHKVEIPYVVDEDLVFELLGRNTIRHDEAREHSGPGVVTGMAWTPVGGEILFIEGTFMPGTGRLTLTGQLGDVMKESANIALSLVRSRWIKQNHPFQFGKSDIHVHVPSGATPKDGPSAGIAIFTALASLVSGKRVDSKTSMTGEVTLSGAVMPVGGIKEKVLAAHRAGIERIILPLDNKKDLEDIPQDAKDQLDFSFVENINEVLKLTMDMELPDPAILEPQEPHEFKEISDENNGDIRMQ
jgi:ATP-dependent Lon protease